MKARGIARSVGEEEGRHPPRSSSRIRPYRVVREVPPGVDARGTYHAPPRGEVAR